MKTYRNWAAGILAAAAVVEYVVWWGIGLGFSLFFSLLILSYYIACGFPQGSFSRRMEHLSLLLSAIFLSATYMIFDNVALAWINGLVLIFLLGVLFLHGSIGDKIPWNRLSFFLEVIFGYLLRPFICLAAPYIDLFSHKKTHETTTPIRKNKTFLQILLAFLLSFPLLLILAVLLSASDPIFASIFTPLCDYLSTIHLSKIYARLFVFLFVFPFVISSIYSLSTRQLCVGKVVTLKEANLRLPQAFVATVYILINLLYILYAAVQFTYLFGSWRGELPDNLTYATYARNGFFELAFISLINAALLICGICLAKRDGKGGVLLRILSLLLLSLSVIQLISAFFRMQLYIQAFGQSLLRYMVFAFMILMALCFLYFVIKEFRASFPLFKAVFFSAILALLLLNYSMPDYQIAKYNTDRYLDGSLTTYDLSYISENLSSDGFRVVLEEKEQLVAIDASLYDKINAACVAHEKSLSSEEYSSYKDFSFSRMLLEQSLKEIT